MEHPRAVMTLPKVVAADDPCCHDAMLNFEIFMRFCFNFRVRLALLLSFYRIRVFLWM